MSAPSVLDEVQNVWQTAVLADNASVPGIDMMARQLGDTCTVILRLHCWSAARPSLEVVRRVPGGGLHVSQWELLSYGHGDTISAAIEDAAAWAIRAIQGGAS